jgi:putative ABC transport system permease protein
MALKELRANKVRTLLSLLGITIGIFCIISVLSTVDSLKVKIQKEISELGNNAIYISKWKFGNEDGGSYPWWKYVNRPDPKVEEMHFIKQNSHYAASTCLFIDNMNFNIAYGDDYLSNINVYGITEEYNEIQPLEFLAGRYINQTEFNQGSPVAVVGYGTAEKLFGKPERALDKVIDIKGKKTRVIGVLKKHGQGMIGGWEFDDAAFISYNYALNFVTMAGPWTNKFIMVKAKPDIPNTQLQDELKGLMRSVRRISPTAEDNFSLNDINMFKKAMEPMFANINTGGWFIAILSLIVGAFGVANIMFVSVRERTSQIGLKKAIGANKKSILTEFLLESAFLCIIGGAIGLLLVYIITLILSAIMPFPVYISASNLILAVGICLFVGLVSGIIPASIAARMDPVVAIRSK